MNPNFFKKAFQDIKKQQKPALNREKGPPISDHLDKDE